ncbi:MAG: NAD(P)/FAD-dependent oxidoreductase [Sarcina sp.]
MSKVIVIGAGPAGMMAAIKAAQKHSVILVDGNEKIGKKLFITGKGRCNVTNSKDISEFFDYIPGNPHFLYSALYTYDNNMVMDFFENQGIKLKSERGGRVFPDSDKSSDIILGFNKKLKESNVQIMLKSKVIDFTVNDNHIKSVTLENGKKLSADYFIVCAGGKSYPRTGSTGELHDILSKYGHTITKIKPSLVPIELKGNEFNDLLGLNLKNISLKIFENINNKNKLVYEKQGEIKFTSYGISGPLTLSGSRSIKYNKDYYIEIDLKPSLDIKTLDARIQKDFSLNLNSKFKDSLNKLLPQQIIPYVLRNVDIDTEKMINSVTKEERKRLVNLLKALRFDVKGLRGIEEAIVTAGGVSTKEIDPSTMKSKIIDNLSFAGEVMDVDAFTGGYNVQIAISTGYLAGEFLED